MGSEQADVVNIDCKFGKKDLLRGLTKLKVSLPEKAIDPTHEVVLFTVNRREATLRAYNGIVTAEVKVPLYEQCLTPGAFGIIGLEALACVRLADSLIEFSVNTSTYICKIGTKGFEWNLRGTKSFPLGNDFDGRNNSTSGPREVDRFVFAKGLEVCSASMSTDQSAVNINGVMFGPDSVRATDANKVAVLKYGTGSGSFTVPALMVHPLRKLLVHGWVNSVRVRANARQLEVVVGDDKMVFGQMTEAVNLDPVLKDLEVHSPKFHADRDMFLFNLRGSGVLVGDAKSLITISRAGSDLVFVVMQGNFQTFEGRMPVTWETPDQEFSLTVNGQTLRSLIGALDGHVVHFSMGTFRGTRPFIRLDEDDRSLFMLNLAS